MHAILIDSPTVSPDILILMIRVNLQVRVYVIGVIYIWK